MRRRLPPAAFATALAVLALLALLAYGVASTGPDGSIDEQVAQGERRPAPELELPTLGRADTASLADFRGQVVVLNYWASWCEPCREESPLLQRWHERMRGQGGTVVGVDVQDVTSDATAFAREYGLSYPMLRDADGESLGRFGVVGYPETFVLDRQGRIASVARGPVDEAFMRETVAPLLAERA